VSKLCLVTTWWLLAKFSTANGLLAIAHTDLETRRKLIRPRLSMNEKILSISSVGRVVSEGFEKLKFFITVEFAREAGSSIYRDSQ
jgi:hypothetical protein